MPSCEQRAPQSDRCRPGRKEVDDLSTYGSRPQAEEGPAPDRGGDHPEAVGFAERLVDHRTVVRAEEEALANDERRTVAGHQADRVAEHDDSDGGAGGRDPLAPIIDPAAGVPDRLHEPRQRRRVTGLVHEIHALSQHARRRLCAQRRPHIRATPPAGLGTGTGQPRANLGGSTSDTIPSMLLSMISGG